MHADPHLHAIVLAAGEGRRLLPLTRALYGSDVPKQFAAIDGTRSLLQHTLDRIAPIVTGERTVVVVPREHAPLARAQLAATPKVTAVEQPRNLDTGPGLLLPLVQVLDRDPDATVLIVPSDHHLTDAEVFRRAALAAVTAAREHPNRLVLLGAVPDHAETEYGWIVPGSAVLSPRSSARGVVRFVEKPPAAVAAELLAQGALWNTFVLAGRARAFWTLARRHLAATAAALLPYRRALRDAEAPRVLDDVYASLAPANFSRAVLERTAELAVLPLPACGWSDLGHPDRVLRSIPCPSRRASLARALAAR